LQIIDISVFGARWRVACSDNVVHDLVCRNFSELVVPTDAALGARVIRIASGPDSRWSLQREHREHVSISSTYELIYGVEKAITIEAQRYRPDLFFLHAAALTFNGHAMLLMAASGSGKSTTAWALTNRGFGYMSDELAPIDLETFEVQPYPHALCLKRAPPEPFGLPPASITTSRTLHVTTDDIPSVIRRPMPLQAIFFNRYDASSAPSVSRVTAGEAAALIYKNGLNQLAHEGAGLEAAVRIADLTACYRLTTNDLEKTANVVLDTLHTLRND